MSCQYNCPRCNARRVRVSESIVPSEVCEEWACGSNTNHGEFLQSQSCRFIERTNLLRDIFPLAMGASCKHAAALGSKQATCCDWAPIVERIAAVLGIAFAPGPAAGSEEIHPGDAEGAES